MIEIKVDHVGKFLNINYRRKSMLNLFRIGVRVLMTVKPPNTHTHTHAPNMSSNTHVHDLAT